MVVVGSLKSLRDPQWKEGRRIDHVAVDCIMPIAHQTDITMRNWERRALYGSSL